MCAAKTVSILVVRDDSDDDRVLECAVSGGAHYIVTGDATRLSHDIEKYQSLQLTTS